MLLLTQESIVTDNRSQRADTSDQEDADPDHLSSNGTHQQPAESLSLQPQAASIDEDTDERGPYHRSILAAAKDGRSSDAETIVQEMAMNGLQPGPRAYHGLICAYCRAQNSQGALSAVRRAVQEGVQPIAETYLVLMHALMVDGDKNAAFKVFQSMLSAGIDARRGWLLLCKDYFRFGFPDDAYALVQKGRLDGWYPDADLYEAMLAWMCTQEDLVDAAEQIVRQEMQEAAIQPEARHANPLVFAEATNVSVHTAMSGPLKEMQEGRLGEGCRPNADTYNAITQGCIWALKRDGGNAVVETLQEVKGDMIRAGLKWNKRTHTLFVEVHLLECNTEFAMMAFEDMVKLSAPGKATEYLSNGVLMELLVALARENKPGDILRVLTVAQEDCRQLPLSAMQPLGIAGGTFVTSWVPAALDSARSMRSIEGLTKKQSEEEDEVDLQEIEGVLIGPGGYAVTEDGAVISASKLTMTQLRGELTARGLSTEGKRQELYRRVQAARSTAPREVADEVRLQEKRKRDKQVREEASMKAKVQKEREKRDVVWRVEQWKDRKLVSVEDVIETEEDGEDEDSEWDEEEQVARKGRQAVDRMYQDLGDDDDLDALRSRFKDADMKANQPWWPQDKSVGELALQIAVLVESLGAAPALGDWALVAKAAAQEHNLAVAGAVLERLPRIAQAAAELGDDRLQMLEENGLKFTGDNIGLVAKALGG
ncbi:g6730 [Coccomyxa elongata]